MKDELLRSDLFHLELDGFSAGGFVRCTGLADRRRLLEVREGGSARVEYLDDGPAGGRIVLERGIASDRALWEWYREGDPRSGAVILVDAGGRERARWRFAGAVPAAWAGPELDAGAADLAVERLEIAYGSLEWESVC